MKTIKTCHLIDASSFNPLLYNSLKYSDRKKIEYTVISLQSNSELQTQMQELGVRSFSVNYSSRKQAAATLLRLYKIFRREKFQIVQTHLLDSSLLGLAAAKLARVPVRIFTGHHSAELVLNNNKILTFVDGLASRILANVVVSPSQQMKDIFIEQEGVAAKKISVIPHGFDLDSWRKQAKISSNIKKELNIKGKVVFGTVGRLFWIKKLEFLIECFAEVSKERNDLVLLIIGEGPDREKLADLIQREKLENKVILVGRRNDMAAVMNDFDVLIHTSLIESFGMIFIEAMALGKPIVTSKVGIAGEIIENGKNGYIFETGNKYSLIQAIKSMLREKNQWQAMGERNKIIADKFDVRETQAQCDRLYLDSVKSK